MANETRLSRRMLGSDLLRYRRLPRAVAGGLVLLLLLWVGAMSPHLVHHLFDEDHGPVCLMSEQGNSAPGLPIVQPKLVLPQTPQPWFPSLPIAAPQTSHATIASPRAPPSLSA
jgi:hypothetical protein